MILSHGNLKEHLERQKKENGTGAPGFYYNIIKIKYAIVISVCERRRGKWLLDI